MNLEDFIRDIGSRPPLWDRKNKNSTKRRITDKLWTEVSERNTLPKEHCKKKWKYLKDEYRKALHKSIVEEANGVPTLKPNKFKFFNEMSFLKETIATPAMRSVWLSSGDVYLHEENTSMSTVDASEEGCFKIEETEIELPTTKLNSNKRKIVSQVVEKKLNSFENSDCTDDDTHFLKSLLPFFKDLAPIQKLELRSELQITVAKYLKNQTN